MTYMTQFEILYRQYSNQLKALNPKYDIRYELSKDEPIEFENSEDVKLSFAAIADIHIVSNPVSFENLNNVFDDCENSKEKFDALLLAGDIAEYGRKKEYEGFFSVFDKRQSTFPAMLITLGNHDARVCYKRNAKLISDKSGQYTNQNLNGKIYYSYETKGYTFIVIATEKAVLEKAYISDEQINWLDNELHRATKDGKPVFVMCHQAFAFTHGLPEVWKTGDMGEQNDQVRAVMEKYKNVFFINGHLHDGVYENTYALLNEENNVHSLSIPSYRKINNFGIRDQGIGYYCCVYDDKVVFKARNFLLGKNVSGDYTEFSFDLI